MDTKKIVLWAVIAILAIVVIYVAFFKGANTSQVVSSAGQIARTSSSGMVGGC